MDARSEACWRVWRLLHDHGDVLTACQVEVLVEQIALDIEVRRAERALGHGAGIKCDACAECAAEACSLGSAEHFGPGICRECGAI